MKRDLVLHFFISEDVRNYLPKHAELIRIINKPLLLHLVICLYYCISEVKVLCYKSEGRCFDPRWCRWNFSLT